MRITEKAAHGMAVKRFRYILFVDRIGIIAGGILLFFAEEAFAACNDEGDDDALTFLQCADGPRLHDLAHELMTYYIARENAWNDAVIELKVRPADGCGCHLTNGTARICILRTGTGIH